MHGQERNLSCAAACLKQLAKDFNLNISESQIRQWSDFSDQMGIHEKGMSEAAKHIFKDHNFGEGLLTQYNFSIEKYHNILSENGAWVAWVREKVTDLPHAIIIDKVENGKVFIRDPWPLNNKLGEPGVKGWISEEYFETIWENVGKYAFWLKK